MRKSTVLLTTGAIVLVAAAAVTRFAVFPAVDQVPANTDITAHLAGTANLLNASALASGDAAHAFLTNQPVTGTQVVKVTSTEGRTAVTSMTLTIHGPDGSTLVHATHVFAVDRVTLEPATAPSGSNAEPHTGLAAGFPLTPAKTTYQYWDTMTRTATPATYTKTDTLNGRSAYVYTIHAAGPIKDPTTLAALPPALPKTALAGLAARLPVAQQQALSTLLPQLPSAVPLTYSSSTDSQAWVDTETGYLLDLTEHQTITADRTTPAGAEPLGQVLDITLSGTSGTVAASADRAHTIATVLVLVGTVAPLTLAGLGLVLVILLVVLARRRPSNTPEPGVREVAADSVS